MSADPGALAGIFRDHFGHTDHLYGWLLERFADDLESGGPTFDICRDRLDASRADVVQLRLLGGLHRVVLRGEAPELEAYYPNLGGTADHRGAWPAFREVLAAHTDELRNALDRPPQTNEVGRSACLAVGLFEAVRRTGLRRVRLLEPGASAGLNLLVDRFRFTGPGWTWGPPGSPLVIDTGAAGAVPEEVEVVSRRGCDLDPFDASSAAGAAYLTSFVWPFDLERHARLAAALAIAAAAPAQVDRAPADAWVRDQLAVPADDGVLTVVWQSITQQYWPPAVSEAVAQAVDAARTRGPVAHLTMEGVPPVQTSDGYDVHRDGPELRLDGELLARSHHHGPPVLLARGAPGHR